MSEVKKLSKEEIAAIRDRTEKALRSAGRFWRRVRPLSVQHWMLGTIENHTAKPVDSDEAWDLIEAAPSDIPALLDHIAAMEAEQQRAASNMAQVSWEVGVANGRFIERQTQRIQALEGLLKRTLKPLGDAHYDEDTSALINEIEKALGIQEP